MAGAVVQSGYNVDDSGSTLASLSVTLSGVTAGNHLIAFAGWGDTGTTTGSVSDGTAYANTGAQVRQASNNQSSQVFYLENAGAGSHTVIFTPSVAIPNPRLRVIEVSGLQTSSSLDQATGASNLAPGTGANAVSSGATSATTNANDFVLGFSQNITQNDPGTGTVTAGTGYTIAPVGGANLIMCIESKSVVATGAQTATFTQSVNNDRITHVAAFKEAASVTPYARRSNLDGPGKHPGQRKFRPIARGYATTVASGDMSGTTTLVFSPTATLTGTGALAGAATLTFSPTATLSGFAPISGASTITFSPTGTLAGIGALSGSSTLTFSPTASLSGTGALSGISTLTFSPTAALTGTGALTGTATITFSPTGTLTDAGGGGNLTGSSSIAFTVVGALSGTGDLAGSSTLTFTVAGTLQNSIGVLAGSSSLTFSPSGTLSDASGSPPIYGAGTGPMAGSVRYVKAKKEKRAPIEAIGDAPQAELAAPAIPVAPQKPQVRPIIKLKTDALTKDLQQIQAAIKDMEAADQEAIEAVLVLLMQDD